MTVIRKVLTSLGYREIKPARANGTTFWHDEITQKRFLVVDERTRAMFDAFYCEGFTDGFERGAYETETKEDV